MTFKNCPKCGESNNISISDCGYSSFNIGTISCSCGFSIQTTCSCYPDKELVGFWNKTIDNINILKDLSHEELLKISVVLYLSEQNAGDKVIEAYKLQSGITKAPKVCAKCSGNGTFIEIKGFYKSPPIKCQECNGTGLLNE